MIKRIDGVPAKYSYAFPHHNRPRSADFYGVTEILYCLRRAFLQRVVPGPTAMEFSKRALMSRGHAMEAAFFGDTHNPEYFVGDGNLEGLEGHSDHVVRDAAGKIDEIVEFKSVRRLWYKAPNGKSYYSITMAKKAIDKADWSKIEHRYNDSHLDQLMLYMYITGAPNGVLIYQEMSTDKLYTWTITSDDISDEFKKRIEDRLGILRSCIDNQTIPDKLFSYDFECGLCNYNKNGVCT